MKVQLLNNDEVVHTFDWPCVLSYDEPLAEPKTYWAMTELEVGETVNVDESASVRRIA